MSENFQIISKIGEGAFATVFKAKRREDGQIYAFKKIKATNMKDRELANCLNEIRILASIKNPYIIGYKEAFYDQTLKSFCLVTEFAENGDLASKINKLKKKKENFKQDEIWKTIIQLLFGIKALHSLNVFHRDIKPANILLSKNDQNTKLADMNVSVISKTGMASTQTGTPYYASPQVWLEKPYSGKSDIWSFGCVIYEMAALRPPFMASDMPTLRKRIIQSQFERIPKIYSDELDKFIRSCLIKDQSVRMKVNQLLQLPIIQQKIKLFPSETFNEPYFPKLQRQSNMISTIRISDRNFKSLENKLPKKKYNEIQEDNKENMKNLYNKNFKIEENSSCLPNIQNISKNNKNGPIINEKLPTIKRSQSELKKNKVNPNNANNGILRREYVRRLRS